MPQSLMIGTPTAPGSIKRQRSTDSANTIVRPAAAGPKASNGGLLTSSVKIPSYLDKTKAEISSAFQDLEWKQRFRLFHAMENPQTSPFRVDRSEAVVSRNRYGNVQPWDQSRVRLATPIAGSDYINASPIVLRSRSSAFDHASNEGHDASTYSETRYIASQGPKDGQFCAFWHMVMQVTTGDVGVIIMLTPCYEANREKCAQYFPASMTRPTIPLLHHTNNSGQKDAGHTKTLNDNGTDSPDLVRLVSSTHNVTTGCDVRILKLTINGNTKTIHHYLFHGWPDFGRPEAEDRAALLELTRESKRIAGDSPRIVHCSAGVGRTGTFIALDFLAREIEEGRFLDITAYPTVKSPTHFHHQHHDEGKENYASGAEGAAWSRQDPLKVITPTTEEFEDSHRLKDDLIYGTVNILREQRMMMVMTELQFSFLYEAIREAFWSKYRARQEGAMIKSPESSETADLPRGKYIRVEGGSDETEAGSASEAETEIMEKEEDVSSATDPYQAVAPQYVLNKMNKEA